MTKTKHNIIARIIIAVMPIVFLAAIMPAALCITIDKIVAIVNDEVITQREVAQLLIPIYEQYKKEYTGKRLQNKMIEARNMALGQLIDDKLILSEAKGQGIKATDKEIDLRLQVIKDRFETEEEFREILVEQNISLSELRARQKNDIIKSKLVRKEMGLKAGVTPIEVREYYDGHIEEFTEPEKVRVYNILVEKGGDGRTAKESGFLIEKIEASIKDGEDFEELAREYSDGPNASEGGSLGLVKKGQMIAEIDNAIFSLEAGQTSDIIESSIGYHIFKITERIPGKLLDFETAKYEIEDSLYRHKIEAHIKKWLTELKKNAYISIK